MYRITKIELDEKTLTLQQVDVPLKGSLVGFRCPKFKFTTLNGQIISNETIRGKTTILDIWAVSCHNCYEGFPVIQRCLEKYSDKNIQVVLLTTDVDRESYDRQAEKIFATYGGGRWPQVMLPGGFHGALTLED